MNVILVLLLSFILINIFYFYFLHLFNYEDLLIRNKILFFHHYGVQQHAIEQINNDSTNGISRTASKSAIDYAFTNNLLYKNLLSKENVDAGNCIVMSEGTYTDYLDSSKCIKCFPSFIIIGAMKCATGELLHPLLRVGIGREKSNQRETHYFTRHVHTMDSHLSLSDDTSKMIISVGKGYLEYFPWFSRKESKSLLTFEKSPDYIRNVTALKLIKSVLPNIKLLVLLRNPVKRALSEFLHHCRHKRYSKILQNFTDRDNKTFVRGSIVRTASVIVSLQADNISLRTGAYYYKPVTRCDIKSAEMYFTASIQQYTLLQPSVTVTTEQEFYSSAIELQNGLYHPQYSSTKVLILLQEEMYRNTFGTLKEVESFLGIDHFNYSIVSVPFDPKTQAVSMPFDPKTQAQRRTYPPKRYNDKVREYSNRMKSESFYQQSSSQFRRLLETYYKHSNQKLSDLLLSQNYSRFTRSNLQYYGWKF